MTAPLPDVYGRIVLVDLELEFKANGREVTYTITETTPFARYTDTLTVPYEAFHAALCVALHFDGLAASEEQWTLAESAMGKTVRWIP